MKTKNEAGFSLIELIIVFVIIGILAVLTFPYASKAKGSAENSNAFASLKTMLAVQYNFYSQNSRYARLDELNNSQYGALGSTLSNGSLQRGNFNFLMSPATPTDEQLREGFTIIATKAVTSSEVPVVIQINERGHATAIY